MTTRTAPPPTTQAQTASAGDVRPLPVGVLRLPVCVFCGREIEPWWRSGDVTQCLVNDKRGARAHGECYEDKKVAG